MGKKKQVKKLERTIAKLQKKAKRGIVPRIDAIVGKQLNITESKISEMFEDRAHVQNDQHGRVEGRMTLVVEAMEKMARIMGDMGVYMDSVRQALIAQGEMIRVNMKELEEVSDLRTQLEALKLEVQEIPRIYNLSFTAEPADSKEAADTFIGGLPVVSYPMPGDHMMAVPKEMDPTSVDLAEEELEDLEDDDFGLEEDETGYSESFGLSQEGKA